MGSKEAKSRYRSKPEYAVHPALPWPLLMSNDLEFKEPAILTEQ